MNFPDALFPQAWALGAFVPLIVVWLWCLRSAPWRRLADSGQFNVWLGTVVLLVLAYHGYCAVLLRQFERDANQRSHRWYRWFNEAPVLMLVAVVVLVVVKPF